MITLCKIDLFALIIFIFSSIWIGVLNALAPKSSILKLLFQFAYLSLAIFVSVLSIECAHWFLFEYWRWGL